MNLPTAELRPLDAMRERNPERAIEMAEAALSDPGNGGNPLKHTELLIIIAYARGAEGRAVDAKAAIDRARDAWQRIVPGSDRHVIDVRLAMGDFGVAKTQHEYQLLLARLEGLMALATPASREWLCLKAARGDVQAELDRPDLAIADQLPAYRLAVARGWTEPAVSVALSLATTYRRSGLWSDAEAAINEVIGYAQQHDLTWLQAMGNFTAGQIFVNERQWDEAFKRLDLAQTLALSVGDRLTAAFATLPACDALINSGRVPEARRRCGGAFATFGEMGRTDLATDSMIYRARIELLDKHYAAALAILDDVLEHRLEDVPSRYKPALYHERADALMHLGRTREAAADFERSITAADAVASGARARTVAVLSGIAKAEALEASNRTLITENRIQREQIENESLNRWLHTLVELACVLGVCLLGFMLHAGYRHRRTLERHAAMLGTLTHNLPDTVMLIDEDLRIRFANRPLFAHSGSGAGPVLHDSGDEDARAELCRIVARVMEERQPAEFVISLSDGDRRQRHFEQCATPIVSGGRIAGVALRSSDVTERYRLEDDLRLQSEILATMNEGVLVIDDDDRITFANAAMQGLTGYAPGQLLGLDVDAIRLSMAGLNPWRTAATTQAPARIEMTLRRRDGTGRLASIAGSRLTFRGHASVICVCRDITDERRVERVLVDAAAHDANRVGNALHEGLAQELTGLSLLTSGLTQFHGGANADTAAQELTAHLTRMIHVARELARLLSPMSTVNGSLDAALQRLTADTARQTGIPVLYGAGSDCSGVDDVTADELHRIAEGAIRHVVRNCNCSRIVVNVTTAVASISLTVTWDGAQGAPTADAGSDLGLQIIRHRTRLLGGVCEERTLAHNRHVLGVTIPTDVERRGRQIS